MSTTERITRRSRVLASCSATHALHDGLADLTYVLLPVLAQIFNLSLLQVGLIRAAHRAAMAAFQIPAALVAEHFGERNLLAIGTLLAGAAFLVLGIADGFWMMLTVLFLAGIGSAVQHPLASTIISRAYPNEGRRAALGTYNFFGDVGKFAFGAAVSSCLLVGISWKAPTIMFGALGVAMAIIIFAYVSDSHGRRTVGGDAGGMPKYKGWGARNAQGLTALCFIEVLDASTRTGFLTFIAFLLIQKGVPEAWATLAVPLVLVGGMAGKLACGLIAEKLGIIRTILITELATGVTVLATVALPAAGALLLLPLLGIVLNGTSSVIYATVGELVEPRRLSMAFGLIYTLGSICGIAAPLGYGFIGDIAGVHTSIICMGIAVMITVPLTMMLRPALETARPIRL